MSPLEWLLLTSVTGILALLGLFIWACVKLLKDVSKTQDN